MFGKDSGRFSRFKAFMNEVKEADEVVCDRKGFLIMAENPFCHEWWYIPS